MGIPGKIILLTVLVTVSLFVPGIAFCLDQQRQMEFDRIFKLNIADLTREAALLLNKKYPDEDWNAYRFPSFVFTSEATEVGYKIAAKEPQSLGGTEIAVKEQRLPCFCSCEAFGHKSLLHCFWQAGKVGGKFDDHAAGCVICYGQAMLAFLWKNLGASDADIIKGMEKKFVHLPKPNER
jgi:hypothetical protein